MLALWPIGAGSWPRQALVAMAIGLWSLRLGSHVARRTAGIDDDPRYRRLKDEWGEAAQTRMFCSSRSRRSRRS